MAIRVGQPPPQPTSSASTVDCSSSRAEYSVNTVMVVFACRGDLSWMRTSVQSGKIASNKTRHTLTNEMNRIVKSVLDAKGTSLEQSRMDMQVRE